MAKRSYIAIAFVMTLFLHAGIAVGFYRILMVRRPEVIPLFRSGDSGLVFAVPETTEPIPEPEKNDSISEPPRPSTVEDMMIPPSSENLQPSRVDPAPTRPTRIEGEGDSSARGADVSYVALSEIWPRYPLGSRLRGEEGVVSVKAKITSAGRAEGVEIAKSSGFKALDRAAEEAVKNARFMARDSSNPGGAEITLSIRFKLRD
jgi:protein TonB